jgi:hypothetical protein
MTIFMVVCSSNLRKALLCDQFLLKGDAIYMILVFLHIKQVIFGTVVN